MVGERREAFEVFISQLVLDEAAAGDPAAARERLVALKDLPQLDITDDVAALAGALVTHFHGYLLQGNEERLSRLAAHRTADVPLASSVFRQENVARAQDTFGPVADFDLDLAF